ncbi:undecaprenyldiphospho-muramoylpentapeptide beta-N-acetylglucosaminyltransferase [Gimesia sp.]|uniref:undecaprenyldiphospho-muramoylpentapeptide beta-N-acetylglucosaminyltransferase n=1 Tax=Gimesia sp. TaxID=2024833 RepID=UPI000C580615|nr:undecaprenyldiphospho-muramoylpentapeptide beta-N-acetylglucosaminyltransferase [Gimesia sp.]MAX40548.1 undecaprenyldiphospho-muramoylpentapeptide beta-N-acetylglucosaminyltransferase [Gimesia sp.]HBL44317.1 undecaprenyldiphospho-muramoylpentapeptide beta-N-acetylglucosaminyltransferase [Planctomycetaceae bacterium]|tara:strand:- start:9121 stop:10281 length:1161 start_codon:yes stop_codon:yes gene_type:complete
MSSPSILDGKSIVFAGGGTGGHLLPGMAVAAELASRGDCRISFVGTNRPVEQQIIARSGFEHIDLPTYPLKAMFRNPFRFFVNNFRAYWKGRTWLRENDPALVVGLGGMASVPVIMEASLMKLPIVLLEQNIVCGKANHFLLGRADVICSSFPDTIWSSSQIEAGQKPRVVVTGNPVRTQIRQLAESANQILSDPAEDEFVILVLGGSQGALAVNSAVISLLERSLDQLPETIQVVHQTGENDFSRLEKAYERIWNSVPRLKVTVKPFFEDLSEWYARAHLVISRSGATTLAELACAGCPTILIPYPGSVNEHQLLNARYFAEHGAAVIVEQCSEPEQTARQLQEAVFKLVFDAEQRGQMATRMRQLALPDAAKRVADEIMDLMPA